MNGYRVSFLAEGLKRIFEKPVVDKTGLRGTFDMELSWSPDRHHYRPEFLAKRSDRRTFHLYGTRRTARAQTGLGFEFRSMYWLSIASAPLKPD